MLEHHRLGSGSGSASPTDKVSHGDFPPDIDKTRYDDMVKILPNNDTGPRARRFEELRTREALPSQMDRYLPEPMQIMDQYGAGRSPTSVGPDEVFYPPRGPTAATRLKGDNDLSRAPVAETGIPPRSSGRPTDTQITFRQNGGVNRHRPTETAVDPHPSRPKPPAPQPPPPQEPAPRKAQLSLPATGQPVLLRDRSAMRKARSMEVLKRGLSLPVLNVERRSLPLSIEEKIDQDIFLEDCKKVADYFVETTTYQAFAKLLRHKDTRGVTLTGGPGTGKTASAMYAAWILHSAEGYLPLKVRTIAEIERIYIEGLKLVFVVDDPFGKLCASSELQQYWRSSAKRLQECLCTDNVKIIATVRTDIWAASQYSVMRYPPFSSAVEISGKLALGERRSMLEKHLGLIGMHPSDPSWADTVRLMTLPAVPPLFPLCCHLVRTSESFRNSATALFYKPMDTMRKDMCNLRKEDPAAFCVLSLMLVHGGKLSRTVLSRPLTELPSTERDKIEQIWKMCSKKPSSTSPSPEEFQQKADKLAKIYVEKTETSLQFSLTSFADVALLEMADLNIELVLRWCHPDVIAGKLIPQGSQPTTSQTMVVVSPKHWPQLAKVLTNEFLAGNVKAILDNPSWKSEDFVLSWKKHIVTDAVREKLRSVSGSCSQGEIVHRAARQGLLTFLRVLLQDVTLGKNGVRLRNEYGQSLLHSAATGGCTNTAQFLLDKGCLVDAVNDAGESPLYLASLHGHTAVVDLLLQNKANPDLTNRLGLGPLHAAVFGERTEVVFTLASHVALETLGGSSRSKIAITSFRDKFLSTLKHSGLHEAARTGDLVRIHHLLDNGFDKNAQNKYGWSPLYITVILGHVEAAALFLIRGANPSITSRQGSAPLDEACSTFNDPLVALLLSYGTKRSSCI
ncbi:uncharacterized protein LOC135481784 [Liolophura sinensis]|uniref:uncharacterized protein LOC135481784 n=1 Tax=Liolophura sinensis TaxID=3198878 RepID=UPI003159631B